VEVLSFFAGRYVSCFGIGESMGLKTKATIKASSDFECENIQGKETGHNTHSHRPI